MKAKPENAHTKQSRGKSRGLAGHENSRVSARPPLVARGVHLLGPRFWAQSEASIGLESSPQLGGSTGAVSCAVCCRGGLPEGHGPWVPDKEVNVRLQDPKLVGLHSA